jgi:hypothetical protein
MICTVMEFDPDPDPLVKGTDPGIKIPTKVSRIPNTVKAINKPRTRSSPSNGLFPSSDLALAVVKRVLLS